MLGIGELQYFDTTGDGVIDTMIHSTGDYGSFETMIIFSDTTDSGIFDTVETFTDTRTFDTNTFNNVEAVEIYQESAQGLELEDVLILEYIDTPDQCQELTSWFHTAGYTHFNPNDPFINPDAIIGTPGADMEFWVWQEINGPCALYSQKFVIEALTGYTISTAEMEALFPEWFHWGTPLMHLDKMLYFYGVESQMSFGNSLDNIAETLLDGGKVIVSVDAYKIWYGPDSAIYPPGEGGHALQVIGIDNTNPNNPMVIMNDPGTPDGRGIMVPADQFMEAWEYGNFQMVTAYA